MPVASSSRSHKRHRRAPSSDIEEDGPSQAQQRQQQQQQRQEEDVEMDDEAEQQARRNKKAKKGKKRAQQDDSDADAAEEEEEDLPVPEIHDQPLERAQAGKLKGMAGDWVLMRDKVHLPGYTFIRDVAASIAEFTEGEKGEKALTSIDTLMRDLMDTEQELTAHEHTLDDMFQKISRGEKIAGVMDVYERGVQESMEAYKSKTSRQKYAKSDHYLKFKQAIYEVHNPDTAMQPLVDLIPQEDGDVSDDDDDVQIGGITQDYKCPLTLTHLVEPLTSQLCGHSYSAAAIKEYLGGGRNVKKQCPASGCHKTISLEDLDEDRALAKRAREAARRERAKEDDSDSDGEVID